MNNKIDVVEAKRRADAFDVDGFKDKAKQYVKEKNFSTKANDELALYNLKMKVSRLELLQHNIDLELIALANAEEDLIDKVLVQTYLDELNLQAGILSEFIPNPKQLSRMSRAIIDTPFQGATWSQRIWQRQETLRVVVSSITKAAVLRGKNSTDFIPLLRKEFGVSAKHAKRLAVTETARVQTAVQKHSYKDNGFEEYEFMAEPSACPICAKLDGKKFKVSDMEPGQNAAPMHPHCHCSTAPYVDRVELDGDKYSLNQAKKHGKFVVITDQAIKKIKKVNIPGYSDIELDNIKMAHQELLFDAKNNNESNEVMHILYGGNPIKIYGNRNTVDANKSSDARFILNGFKDKSITVIHNHPGGSSFSMNDISFFMNTKSVKTLTIVTNQGKVMFLTKTDSFDRLKILEQGRQMNVSDKSSYIEEFVRIMYNNGVEMKIR